MSQCNYCSLVKVKKRAKLDGNKVTIKPGTGEDSGWMIVYVHKKKTKPIEKDRIATMMEIPDHCCC